MNEEIFGSVGLHTAVVLVNRQAVPIKLTIICFTQLKTAITLLPWAKITLKAYNCLGYWSVSPKWSIYITPSRMEGIT